MPETPAPRALRSEGDALVIDWADGQSARIPWQTLRKNCPCATCNDERLKPVNPFRILSDAELAAGDPRPAKMVPIGYYAYKIVWNDGHDTGIYTLDALRALGAPPS